jgi:hypothetical protein
MHNAVIVEHHAGPGLRAAAHHEPVLLQHADELDEGRVIAIEQRLRQVEVILQMLRDGDARDIAARVQFDHLESCHP